MQLHTVPKILKQYLYAKSDRGKVVALIVFVPFLGKKGYMADVTRHGNDARRHPRGVLPAKRGLSDL